MRVALLALCLLAVACSPRLPAEFNANRWREADLNTPERASMAAALVRHKTLHGMDRRAVVALLGEPTPSRRFGETELAYVLGPSRSMWEVDRDWLLIQLDRRGQVAGYRVIADEASRFR
jgi:outer membrane protein assembly factor BamE (lipoprotein component of BamABCDE complex)